MAGDDPAGKRIVSDLVDELGFDPVDAGTLAESWRQRPGTPVYGTDLDAAEAAHVLGLGWLLVADNGHPLSVRRVPRLQQGAGATVARMSSRLESLRVARKVLESGSHGSVQSAAHDRSA